MSCSSHNEDGQECDRDALGSSRISQFTTASSSSSHDIRLSYNDVKNLLPRFPPSRRSTPDKVILKWSTFAQLKLDNRGLKFKVADMEQRLAEVAAVKGMQDQIAAQMKKRKLNKIHDQDSAKVTDQVNDEQALREYLLRLANRYYDSAETKGERGLPQPETGLPPPWFYYAARRLRWADYMQDRMAELLKYTDKLPAEYNMIFNTEAPMVKIETEKEDGESGRICGLSD
ncbi:hypothetical protein SLS59_007040 [Nothophoma quercina]|uniref:Uncharacterized protein n=1 Tax=Nothophoma quercina TaxID=749835 RepID=A0ABR3R1Q7_9PLEO